MTIKTDMSKTYDQVEWCSLRKVLECLGFQTTWIRWILDCVTSVCYSFLLNGSESHKEKCSSLEDQDKVILFHPIFLSYVRKSFPVYIGNTREQFTSGVKSVDEKPTHKSSPICRWHYVFGNTTPRNCAKLKEILERYGRASGQSINHMKLSIVFSAKTHRSVWNRFKRYLQIMKEGGSRKYLGLAEHFGRRKRNIFNSLVDKIKKKSHSWVSRFLSAARIQVMLKVVLSSMPSFSMFCFKIPISLCKKFQSILTRFWWIALHISKEWVGWFGLSLHYC